MSVAFIDQWAPVRPKRRRVVVPTGDVPKPSSATLTRAIGVITHTSWVTTLSQCLPQRSEGTGGRARTITLEAFLVAALCLPLMERPQLVRDIARLLDQGLDQNSRRRLGIHKDTKVTERMVSYLFNQLTAAIDPSAYSQANAWLFDTEKVADYCGISDPSTLDAQDLGEFANAHISIQSDRLEALIRAGLAATHPEDAPHAGDYAMDATFIDSWENPKTSRRRTKWSNGTRKPIKPWLLADPDARWWSKKGTGKGKLAGKNDSGLGYAVTAITRVEEDHGPGKASALIPYLIEHISVVGARGSMVDEGSRALARMVAHHEHADQAAGREHRMRGDLLADREYSRVARWQKNAHVLGFTPHFMLAAEQLGHTTTLANGSLVIDGIPYSPGIPTKLRQSSAPVMFATRHDRGTSAAYYAQRAPYRIKAVGGGRDDKGSIKLTCPASNLSGHAIACANKPASVPGRPGRITVGTALPVISLNPKPAMCDQSTATATFDELPFWQPHIPFSPEHQWSVNRRNHVESAYGRIKDEATQSLRRGTVRVMGRAKVTFMILLVAMAANIVEVDRWRAKLAADVNDPTPAPPVPRTPRRLTLKREAEKARIGAALAARAAGQGKLTLVSSGAPPSP